MFSANLREVPPRCLQRGFENKKVSVHIISGEDTYNLTMQRCLCCVSLLPLKSRSNLLFSCKILATVNQKSFPLIWLCLCHFLSTALEKGWVNILSGHVATGHRSPYYRIRGWSLKSQRTHQLSTLSSPEALLIPRIHWLSAEGKNTELTRRASAQRGGRFR